MKKPNIILIITDSQGFSLLGKCGQGYISTPNIDRLADEGMQFLRAYNCCPLCTPARSALFSGQYSHNNGAWANDLPLGKTVKTIGSYFSSAGYRTAYIGKWHLDGTDYYGTGIAPEGYDPKYWYDGRNHLESMTDEQRKLWRTGLRSPEDIKRHNITREFTWAGNATDKAVSFLSEIPENDDMPYLLVISYDEPHGPSVCPPPYCDMYMDFGYPLPENFKDPLKDKPVHHREWANSARINPDKKFLRQPLYFGCASFVDNEIGKVLDVIEEKRSRLMRNTIVIFTSDHGHYMGAHGLSAKGPALYEEVVKVPLIIKADGITKPSSVSNSLASHIDIVPTLMDLAGIEISPIIEGKSMRKTLLAPEHEYRSEAFVEFNRFSVSHDSWYGFIPIRSIVTKDYKLVINLHQTDELYDFRNDPGEMKNLIDYPEYSKIRDELHDRLIDFMNESRDPFRGIAWGNKAVEDFKEVYVDQGKETLKAG